MPVQVTRYPIAPARTLTGSILKARASTPRTRLGQSDFPPSGELTGPCLQTSIECTQIEDAP